jgi:hypothetical protein
VLINEVAWAGTLASASDEWIELWNTTAHTIDLEGWSLTDDDDIHIRLQGMIAPYSYFLLERTDDATIADITADLVYTGSLNNSGDTLRLLDLRGQTIDSANADGGGWTSGSSATRASMERRGGTDIPGNWGSFTGSGGNGSDAAGFPIQGTPGRLNSVLLATPLPPTPTTSPAPPSSTPFPGFPAGVVLINEIAWAGTIASASDEWIELHNTSPQTIDLAGWQLTDGDDLQITLSGTIHSYGYFLLERSDDQTVASIPADQTYNGSLHNAGERLSLRDPAGNLIDSADGSSGWPAGDAPSRASMERLGGQDGPGNWMTYMGTTPTAFDFEGTGIPGTPRSLNSPFLQTPVPSPSSTPTSPPVSAGAVIINEVAWAGTLASASDEWIELLYLTSFDIDLSGWRITDGMDINVPLQGVLPPYGYFLLERSDDRTISDMPADLIYTGGLSNAGERLALFDPSGRTIDTANASGRSWPAGDVDSRASMERRGGGDQPGNWGTFTGFHGGGRDADGRPIQGSPGRQNSLFFPTPAPTWIPGRVVINEVLIRPHYDWNGDGKINTGDEFIELYNQGPHTVDLEGWYLDDIPSGGSRPYQLRGIRVGPDSFFVLFHSRTRISLNDTGDSVRLLAPDERVIDSISYLRFRAYNLSYGRLPDGSHHLRYGLWPTARMPNMLFNEDDRRPSLSILPCGSGRDLDPVIERYPRSPYLLGRMAQLGHLRCPPLDPVLPAPPRPFFGLPAPDMTLRGYLPRREG